MFRVYRKGLIIADDLTGCCDTAAQFSKVGYKVVVTSTSKTLSSLIKDYDVIALNTNTRAVAPSDAYRRVYDVCCEIKGLEDLVGGNIFIYKKVDSTLRGNILEEVKAIYDGLKPNLMVFTPAYPKQRRTTIKGIHMVNGVPVDRTYFGKDVRTPVKNSYIPSYFTDLFKDRYRHILIDELRSDNLPDIGGYEVISSDIEVEEDFHRLIGLVSRYSVSGSIIWIGSAGLSEQLTRYVIITSGYAGPVLMCLGSLNVLLRRQVLKLLESTRNVTLIPLNIRRLIMDYEYEYHEVLSRVISSRDSRPQLIVLTSAFYDEQVKDGMSLAGELNIDRGTLGDIIADYLGRICASIVNELGMLGGLVLCGGDTALATIKYLGINALRVVGEVEPGIPMLYMHDMNLRVITKAGGFGDELTLVRIAFRLSS